MQIFFFLRGALAYNLGLRHFGFLSKYENKNEVALLIYNIKMDN
jgi:hypothetical protein